MRFVGSLIMIGMFFAPMAFAQGIQGQPTFRNSWSLASNGNDVVSDSGIQGDSVIVLYGGKFYHYPYYTVINGFSHLNVKMPFFPASEIANKFKYRNETFWFTQHNTIYKFNKISNKFEMALKPKIVFDTFEIDSNGLILLIGSRQLPKKDEPVAVRGELTIRDLTTAHFIHGYKENSENSEFIIDYPDEYWECVSRVEGLSGKNKTWALGNNVLIFVRDMGFLYNYDSEKHSIHKVDVPWPCLSEQWLNEPQMTQIATEAKAQGKPIDLARNGLPNYIQIMPTNGRIVVAYKENPTEVAFTEKVEAEYRARGAFIAFFKNVPSLDENGNSRWALGELNLTKNSISDIQKIPASTVPMPFWSNSNGDLTPIDGFIRMTDKAKNDFK